MTTASPRVLRIVVCLVFIFTFPCSSGFSQESRTAQTAGPQAPELQNVRVRYLTWPDKDTQKAPVFSIAKGTSQIFRFDRNIQRVSVSDPKICDVTTLGTKEVLINSKESGLTNLIVWDEAQHITSYDIYSVLDPDKLSEVLKNLDHENTFQVVPFNNNLAVYGMTSSAEKLKQINQAVTSYNEKAVSFVTLKNPKQILLEVRLAEITRSSAEDFGLDLEGVINAGNKDFVFRSLYGGNLKNATDPSVRPSSITSSEIGPTTGYWAGLPDNTTPVDLFGTMFSKNVSMTPILQWLQTKGVLKLIARPNLLAKDGEEAKFQVGGEFPIPVSNTTTISVDYREYGTQLTFKPEILESNRIRLKTKIEVSELDFAQTITLGNNTVPSIIKRLNETVSELKDGETLLVGGMITQRINETEHKMPFFGDLPVIEKFFKRKEFIRSDVELVILITPHIVDPFMLQNKSKYFPPEVVKQLEKAVEIYKPVYQDRQADAMAHTFTQGEKMGNFSDWKKTTTDVMDKALREQEILDEITSQSKIGQPPQVISLDGSKVAVETSPGNPELPQTPVMLNSNEKVCPPFHLQKSPVIPALKNDTKIKSDDNSSSNSKTPPLQFKPAF